MVATTRMFRDFGVLTERLIVLSMLLVISFTYVSVYAAGMQNIGLGKSASQIDTYSVYGASNAVDGSTNCVQWAQTKTVLNTWWKVDLGQLYVIDHVSLYNRLDDAGDRLRYVKLLIGLYDDHYVQFGYHDGIFGANYTFYLPQYVYGRWVQITRVPGLEYRELTLCEVQVMGTEITNVKYQQRGRKTGTGGILGSSRVNTKVTCCVQCKMTIGCVAVNYNSDTGVCEKLQTVTTTRESDQNKYFYRLN